MNTEIHNIDSSFINENEKNTKFKYIFHSTLKNITSINLKSINIPTNTFNIQKKKKNNYFTVIQNNKNILINIPDGNYTNLTLKNFINEKLDKIKLEYNNNNSKFTFSSTYTFELNFSNQSEYNSLGKILGFENLIYDSKNSYTGENTSNLIDFTYCFLKINDLGNLYHLENKYVAKILIPNNNYNLLVNKNNFISKNIILPQPINLSSLNIELVDPLGNLINLNNVPFNFTIEFNMINNSLLKDYNQLAFYDKDLMEMVVNDTLLEYYTHENNNNIIGKSYENFLESNLPNMSVEVDDIKRKIDQINVRLDNNEDMKKIEEEDMKRREEKRKQRYLKKKEKERIANKLSY